MDDYGKAMFCGYSIVVAHMILDYMQKNCENRSQKIPAWGGRGDHKVPPPVEEFLSSEGHWESVSDSFRDAAPERLLVLR